jgi:hypothetical protein
MSFDDTSVAFHTCARLITSARSEVFRRLLDALSAPPETHPVETR